MKMIHTPCDVIELARGYVGVPYRHQGRSRQGVDCIGLAWLICRDIGADVADFGGYGPEPFNGTLLREVQSRGLRATGAHPGMLALMRWFGEPQHAAIITDIGTVIHAHARVGRVVEHNLDARWAKRIVHTFGFPNVNYEDGLLAPASVLPQAKPAVVPRISGECLPCRKAA